MANFNTLIKRKQYIWLGLILAGGAAAVGGGLYLSDLNMSSDEEAPAQGEPAPDMTGVVDSSFNSKVEQHATTEMQATAADLNKRFDSLQGEVDLLSKARTADQIRIDKLSSDNEAMQTQLASGTRRWMRLSSGLSRTVSARHRWRALSVRRNTSSAGLIPASA